MALKIDNKPPVNAPQKQSWGDWFKTTWLGRKIAWIKIQLSSLATRVSNLFAHHKVVSSETPKSLSDVRPTESSPEISTISTRSISKIPVPSKKESAAAPSEPAPQPPQPPPMSTPVATPSPVTEAPSIVEKEGEKPFRTTTFIATEGLSQHSPKYQFVVGEKRNFDGTQEPVYFATASCTPLAIGFAVTAQEANRNQAYATPNTPRDYLDSFLGDKSRVEEGVREINHLIEGNVDGVSLDNMNLGLENGLRVYLAMGNSAITKRTYRGDNDKAFSYDFITQADATFSGDGWYESVLSSLTPGEGAAVIFGGYTIGVRHIGERYEIFDSHNSNSYTGKQGACIISCANSKEFLENIEKIRNAGSAAGGAGGQMEAQGIEIYVF